MAVPWRRSRLPLILLATGVGLRVFAVVHFPVASDAAEYAVLSTSILEGHGMWLPLRGYWGLGTMAPSPSHHYPPVYPIYLVPFLAAFGPGTFATQAAAFAAALGLLAVFYRATASLFGRVQ